MRHTHLLKNKFTSVLLTAALLIVALPASMQAKDPRGESGLTQRQKFMIDSVIRTYVREGNLSGIVTLSEENSIVFNEAYGQANKQLNIPNSIMTKFEIGSVSKQFCAVMILMAAQEGRINLDSLLGKYLPYTKQAVNNLGNSVTIRQLLQMRSGIPSYDNFPEFLTGFARENFTYQDFIMKYCGYPIAPTPGTAFDYSDGNYYILGVVLESLYNKSYAQLLKDKIFSPLHMSNSGFFERSGSSTGSPVVAGLGNGYVPVINSSTRYDAYDLPIAKEHSNAAWINMSDIAYASGAIYMTGEDFIKWTTALNENTLLTPRYQDQMFHAWSNQNVLQTYYPDIYPGLPNTGYGYAMVVVSRPGYPDSSIAQTVYTHGGLTPGYSSVGAMFKDKKNHDRNMTIFISSNINTDAPLFLCWQILNIMVGNPVNYHVPY